MPTIKQKVAFKKTLENRGNVTAGMKAAGYEDTTVHNPQELTQSKGWLVLMNRYLSDDKLVKHHDELLKQMKVEYFVFNKSLSDEEIKGHVNAAGFDVITIRSSDKGKLAFYSVPDSQAKQKALDMAYKLKGSYSPEKTLTVNLTGDVKDMAQYTPIRDKYEQEILETIKNETNAETGTDIDHSVAPSTSD